MILKILAAVTLVKVCAGNAPADTHKPTHPSNYAVSSQSYVRQNPSNIKHRPHTHFQRLLENYIQPKAIQYAPIIQRNKEIKNGVNSVPATERQLNHNARSIQNMSENTKLEPQINISPERLTYVPGYNVELLQPTHRYPGYNAMYRSYPNMQHQDKLNERNFLNQFVINEIQHEPHRSIFTKATEEQSWPTTSLFEFVPKQYKSEPHIKSDSYNTNQPTNTAVITPLQTQDKSHTSQLNIQQQQVFAPHPLTHRMLLNVARAYNIANLPIKAHNRSKKTSTYAQVLMKQADAQSASVGKTRLYTLLLQHL